MDNNFFCRINSDGKNISITSSNSVKLIGSTDSWEIKKIIKDVAERGHSQVFQNTDFKFNIIGIRATIKVSIEFEPKFFD